MVRYSDSDSKIGLVSPKIYFAKGYEFYKKRYQKSDLGKIIWYAGGLVDWKNMYATHRGVDEVDYGQYARSCDTEFATGCCLLIKKKVIDTVGLFDRNYFLYFEDLDLSIRSKNMGFKVKYYPEVYLWHKNAASSDKPGSKIQVYYQTRNRLYFGYKYATLSTKKSLFLDSLRLLKKGNPYTSGVIDYYLGRMKEGNL
ncbi:MAG: hypothetical protein A2161_14515 [Candidatus Schekmanbacteria bacterium RBG_13_48_7]|uniref:Glycosyltransferase 2-like domain-containing protein n=1 Tax=Candidatus Schekmanbacteria bacterium RBG_13_48_7 TaxID=1817878 RepID=A0A1F7S0J5_9BACT|nr:MAG: hypothetical protein A2161_14515 [Candidatus Schekmanbacteria bacterium RBG_13_48_7]